MVCFLLGEFFFPRVKDYYWESIEVYEAVTEEEYLDKQEKTFTLLLIVS